MSKVRSMKEKVKDNSFLRDIGLHDVEFWYSVGYGFELCPGSVNIHTSFLSLGNDVGQITT